MASGWHHCHVQAEQGAAAEGAVDFGGEAVLEGAAAEHLAHVRAQAARIRAVAAILRRQAPPDTTAGSNDAGIDAGADHLQTAHQVKHEH